LPGIKDSAAHVITKAEAAARLFVNSLNSLLMSKAASPAPQ
jgi:hypothetical protein